MHVRIHIVTICSTYSSNMLLRFDQGIVLAHHSTISCITLSTSSSPSHMTEFIINSSRWFSDYILAWLTCWCRTICSWSSRACTKSCLIRCEVHLLLLSPTLQQRPSSSSRSSKILIITAQAFLTCNLRITLKLTSASNITSSSTCETTLVIQDLVHCWGLAVCSLFLNLSCFGSFWSGTWCLLLWLHCWNLVLLISTISIVSLGYSLWSSLTYLVIIIILLTLILIPLCWWISDCIFNSNLFIFLFNCCLSILLSIFVLLLCRLKAWVGIWRPRCTDLLFRYLLFLLWRTLITIIFSVASSTTISIRI